MTYTSIEPEQLQEATSLSWPHKHDLFGVQVSATSYDEAVTVIVSAAQLRHAAVASLHAAHAVVSAAEDPDLLRKVNQFELIGPDGQPVRWALNWLHGTALKDRV